MLFQRFIHLKSTPEVLWPLLSDTEHLNREIGLPRIKFTFLPRQIGGTNVEARARIAGLDIAYHEGPFTWVVPRHYSVRREFPWGPLRFVEGGAEISAEADGSRVRVWAEVGPRNILAVPICSAFGYKSVRDALNAYVQMDQFLTGNAVTPYPNHVSSIPVNQNRLNRSMAELVQCTHLPKLLDRLGKHIVDSTPEDLLNIRPYKLAEDWSMNRADVLRLFLSAVRVGLFDMRWRVLCPYCRGGTPSVESLAVIQSKVHCQSCNIPFDSTFDESVEVVFDIAPAIRKVEASIYCVGGPGVSRHAPVQWAIGSSESRTDSICLSPGKYQLTSLQSQASVDFGVSPDGVSEVKVQLTSSQTGAEWQLSDLVIAPESRWSICNKLEEHVVARIENPSGNPHAATAAEVTSLQEFRDQFGSEVLSPGVDVAVRSLSFLFSDLRGSTAMYREQGDTVSYRRVWDHFTILRGIITQNNGAVVKTIGDSVMAVFYDSVDGLRAAWKIQQEFADEEHGLCVKLGMHRGPAIAVNANGILDYFGQTVNLAARLQKLSLGRDLVLTRDLFESLQKDPVGGGVLACCTPISLEAQIPGIDTSVSIIRLTNPHPNPQAFIP